MSSSADQENIFNSPIERTKFILKWWSKFLAFCKVIGEVLLWAGSCSGPLMVLTLLMLADFYLVWKPAIFTFLPGSDYKKAFLAAKKEVARFFRNHLAYWHRHEINGFEKIPSEGGALIVYYHASIPIDYVGLITKTYLEKGRLIRSVMDRNLILLPGAETLLRTFGGMPGGREEVIKLLKEGHLVGVAPGGGYEAQLATNSDYPVMWKQRRGFAVVAKEAGVPIIPMFTENVREAYVNMESGMELWNGIYNKTNAPFTPLYGGFPVKLTSYIGDWIDTKEKTVEELRVETIIRMQKLIRKHQQLPGNVYRAVKERFQWEFEKEEEDFVECTSEVDEFDEGSVESLPTCEMLSDSGCGSVASNEDEDEETYLPNTNSPSPITRLPNGKLVLLGAM